MCGTEADLTVLAMALDYMITVWSGMIQIYPFGGGQSHYFYHVIDGVYCIGGIKV